VVSATVAVVVAIFVIPWAGVEKRHRLCDEHVATLLTSKDLVEVTRSAFLVRHLDCNVSSRAP
jgi:hypothetical protein